jgi:hypothetical protein
MIRAQIPTESASTSELPLVMVVDDDIFFGQLVQDVLDEYQVVLCTDAVMALEQLDELTPQAMIIDLLMPAATGFSLIQELISHDDLNKIPLIICSSVASEVDAEFLQASGVQAILDKNTIQPQDLKLTLKRLGV